MSGLNFRNAACCKMAAGFSLMQVFFIAFVIAASAQSACAADDTLKLRFVTELNVKGCPVIVHDTGASDSPHLAVEPLMCVKSGLNDLVQRFDPILDTTYVQVPVTLWDDSVLAEVQTQLRNLSPKSVKFARIFDIRVSSNFSRNIRALGFDWAPERQVGYLRFSGMRFDSNENIVSSFHSGDYSALNWLLLSVSIASDANDRTTQVKYRPVIQNQTRFDVSVGGQTYLPPCQLRFIQSIRVDNCVARVHEKQDRPGHFLIEPLLCQVAPNASTLSPLKEESGGGIFYMELDVQLQNDTILNLVKTRLADMSPLSVTFMRLWRAESQLVDFMSWSPYAARYDIGPLRMSADGKSALVRVYCNGEGTFRYLNEVLTEDPFRLWRNVRWTVSARVESQCQYKSLRSVSESSSTGFYDHDIAKMWYDRCPEIIGLSTPLAKMVCQFSSSKDGRRFVTIQQRIRGSVSFQQTWSEYENGFGYDSDFWIGLKAINTLSKNGVVLRVEMKLLNDAQLYAEYSGFQVKDSSTEYQMNYTRLLRNRSNVDFDALQEHKGMRFSTKDRDNDEDARQSCSMANGEGGWWFRSCQTFNPNGLLAKPSTLMSCNKWPNARTATWARSSFMSRWALKEVRLMLQI